MKNKKIIFKCAFIVVIILIPIFLDWLIFGNNIYSNLDNSTWANFLGGYLGGIATLIGVYITINENNKELEIQRKFDVKPYLESGIFFFNHNVLFGDNDRVFIVEGEKVEKVGHSLSLTDRKTIEYSQKNTSPYAGINYYVRNIGAGSAVNMQIIINGFEEQIAVAKDEKVNMYMIVHMCNIEEVEINIELKYWDVENREHYSKKDSFKMYYNDGDIKSSKLHRGDVKEII